MNCFVPWAWLFCHTKFPPKIISGSLWVFEAPWALFQIYRRLPKQLCTVPRGFTGCQKLPKLSCTSEEALRSAEVAHKVAQYFPVTSRLKRMFCSTEEAAALTCWAVQQFDGHIMRHVSQSKQWEFINNRFQAEFGEEDRNVRMALVADGINPSGDKTSVYSLRPVLLLNYNLPPWLSTKKYFMLLAILIPRPKSVIGDHFDVFLNPLIDEMLELWNHGVHCMDASNYKRSSNFVWRLWSYGQWKTTLLTDWWQDVLPRDLWDATFVEIDFGRGDRSFFTKMYSASAPVNGCTMTITWETTRLISKARNIKLLPRL